MDPLKVTSQEDESGGSGEDHDIVKVHDAALKELVYESSNKKSKKNKKKKKKSKLRRRIKKEKFSSDDESSDSFNEDFQEAVLDTNLDTVAERQLQQLSDMQTELNDLQKATDDDNEEEVGRLYHPPSNQLAVHEKKVYPMIYNV